MVIGGERLDLGKVTVPVYHLATREDHIAPAKSVFTGAKLFGGEVRYVLAGSGHIAGVVNPRGQAEISILDRPAPRRRLRGLGATGRRAARHLVAGLGRLARSPGIRAKCRRASPAAAGSHRSCDAPGTYVKIRA